MSKYSDVKKLIREIVKDDLSNQQITPQRGTVTKIVGQTCEVRLLSGLVISDVKLKAVITEDTDYLLLYPVIGSDVLIFDSTVISIDKVKKFEFSQSGLKVVFDSSDKKVKIENSEVNLLSAILELTDILKNNYNLFTSNGPTSGTLPVSKEIIIQTENKFKKLLK